MRRRTRVGAALSAATLTFVLASCGDEAEVSESAGAETDPDTEQSTEDPGGDEPTEDPGEDEPTEDPGGDEPTEDPGGDEPTEDPGGGSSAAGESIPVEEFLDRMMSADQELALAFGAEMTMDVMGEQVTMIGTFDARGEYPEMHLSMDMLGTPMEMILVDQTAYMSAEGITSPGMWVELPEEELEGSGLDEAFSFDESFDAMEAGAEEVTFVGTDVIDGDPVDVFIVVVDADKAMEAEGDHDDLAALPPGTKIEYEVWLDDDHLPRKMAFEIQGAALEMRMFDYGDVAPIEAPSADEIEDLDLGF